MRQITFLISIFCLINISAFSQAYITSKTANGKLKKLYESGIQQSFNAQLKGALYDIERALEIEPNFIDARIAWSNIQYDMGNLESAERGFEMVLDIDKNYSVNAYYNLALIEKKLGKYGESEIHFQAFLDSNPRSSLRKKKAQDSLKQVVFLKEVSKNLVLFNPVNLGSNINTTVDEFLPALTADGTTLIYTVMKGRFNYDGQQDFYKSEFINGQWSKGVPISAINTLSDEGAQSISADGKLLFFTSCYRKEGNGSCDIFFTEYKCGSWSKMQIVDMPVSTESWESQPSISADGKTLYFSSKRKGGMGKKDIWYSERNINGTWENPKNMGSEINTAGDEIAPFIHFDGETMYFLSTGLPGVGDSDLFISRRQEDETWGKPKNLGIPINSPRQEGPLSVSLDGKTAFFSSDRSDLPEAKGRMDIYTFELPEHLRAHPVTYVKGVIKDAENRDKLQAQVEIFDLATGKVHSKLSADCAGEFLITLPIGKNYMLNINKEKYLFHSENFELTGDYDLEKPYLLKIDLIPIVDDITSTGDTPQPNSKPIVLRNVFFETGSAELLSTSILELNQLKNLLTNYPNLHIQINGHTDNVGTEEDNLALSSNRAKAVHDWLIENEISSNRLKFKGFGEKKSIATNTTEKGRKINRRVEFMVIE